MISYKREIEGHVNADKRYRSLRVKVINHDIDIFMKMADTMKDSEDDESVTSSVIDDRLKGCSKDMKDLFKKYGFDPNSLDNEKLGKIIKALPGKKNKYRIEEGDSQETIEEKEARRREIDDDMESLRLIKKEPPLETKFERSLEGYSEDAKEVFRERGFDPDEMDNDNLSVVIGDLRKKWSTYMIGNDNDVGSMKEKLARRAEIESDIKSFKDLWGKLGQSQE